MAVAQHSVPEATSDLDHAADLVFLSPAVWSTCRAIGARRHAEVATPIIETTMPSLFRPSRDRGHDPDYRFSLANERTFLAWIRTALALNAGGLAVAGLLPQFAGRGRELLALALIGLGTVVSARSVTRWVQNEEAMRTDAPLPPSHLPAVLAVGVMATTVIGVVLLLLEGRP